LTINKEKEMFQHRRLGFFVVVALALALLLPMNFALGAPIYQAATPTPAPEEEATEEQGMNEVEMETETELETELVTARAYADLVRPGRVLMSARGNHWIYDSPASIGGPNEAVNPIDGILGGLISCGMYIYEAVAIEQRIPLNHLSATASAELDPRGLAGTANVNPRLRAFHVTVNVEGPNVEQAAMMAEAFSKRCPIHTTLARSAPITVTNVVYGQRQDPFVTEVDPINGEEDVEEDELQLARPMVRGRMVEYGRALLSARGNHWIYDSVPPIHGPNEEVNPLDALLGALPACGIMIYEVAAPANGIALHSVSADVEADLDPRGVAGANVDPRVRAFRVTMHVSGPTAEEAELLAEEFRTRCPIYTTFERSAPIEIVNAIGSE